MLHTSSSVILLLALQHTVVFSAQRCDNMTDIWANTTRWPDLACAAASNWQKKNNGISSFPSNTSWDYPCYGCTYTPKHIYKSDIIPVEFNITSLHISTHLNSVVVLSNFRHPTSNHGRNGLNQLWIYSHPLQIKQITWQFSVLGWKQPWN